MFQHQTPPPSSPAFARAADGTLPWSPGPEDLTEQCSLPDIRMAPSTPQRPRESKNTWINTPAGSSPSLPATSFKIPTYSSPTRPRRSAATPADAISSSPPRPFTSESSTRKDRKPPSVTPRRFNKFFAPRSSTRSNRGSRCALSDISPGSLNGSTQSSPLHLAKDIPRSSNKRASSHASGELKLPSPKRQNISYSRPEHRSTEKTMLDKDIPTPELPTTFLPTLRVPLNRKGTAAQVFQRELGDLDRRFDVLNISHPVLDWRHQTADFCSSFDNVHSTARSTNQMQSSIFSQASCNTTDMVIIGDDTGHLRLLNTSSPGEDGFKTDQPLRWRAHDNAITDVTMSADDVRAASVSADRSGIIWDIQMQKPVALLDCETSAKSVRFQPGKGGSNVIATSNRQGTIHIWDLRCKSGSMASWSSYPDAPNVPSYNTIISAHKRPSAFATESSTRTVVTSLEFLPAGKEHLILSACEANATIKLWDIRAIGHKQSPRSDASKAVSCVAPPAGHNFRDWGISSMALGTDGARLYALCKDNTVYAYSTAHLALGVAPELDRGNDKPSRRSAPVHTGLAPLYGFRHPLFTSPSFFVKCSVRPSRDGRSELLAVGSGHGTPVLFPTDERYLHVQQAAGTDMEPTDEGSWGFPVSTRHVRQRPAETTPIFTSGTPLIHGHAKEATSVCFARSGALVSASDDLSARVWSEDREEARRLRRCGWSQGERWGHGWASVEDDFDQVGDDEF